MHAKRLREVKLQNNGLTFKRIMAEKKATAKKATETKAAAAKKTTTKKTAAPKAAAKSVFTVNAELTTERKLHWHKTI